MPNIYEYLGFTFFFYANDHEPRHVHVEKGDKLIKVELEEANGIRVVRFKRCGNAKSFSGAEKSAIHRFINVYHLDIIKKWNTFFIAEKKPKFDKVNIKLKRETFLYKVFGL